MTETSVDFLSVGCAATATTKEVTVTNTGTANLTFSYTLAGSSDFTVTSPATSTVSPGASAKIVVAAAVPGTSAAGVDVTGTLTVNTNDPGHAKFDVPLKLKTSGVTLTLTPSAASFGVLPVNTQAPDLALTLTNTGNVPATISFTQPTDTQFSLKWTGMPATVTVAPAGSVPGLAAAFKANKINASSTAANITVVEPKCGTSVATIPMTGQGTNGVVGFSTTDVNFGTNGRVNCGTTAAAKTFNITNTGNLAFSWTGTLAKGAASPFTFSPTSGTVPANTGSVTITVTPAAGIPAAASTALDAFGDILSIVTDAANDTDHSLNLHQTANGSILTFAPSSIDFGVVPINNTANAPISIVNDGNATANVTLASSNGKFNLNPAGPTAVGGGTFSAATATFAPGTSVVRENSNVTLTVDAADVLCAPLPSAATLTGLGTTASVSYTPVALDFGNVSCGATAAAKTVTFKNGGNQDYTITPGLAKGTASSFIISMSPDSGVVPFDGGTVVITATPKPIPQTSAVTNNLYGDTLTVTTDVTNDPPHNIPLRETASGAIFAIALPGMSLDFGSGTLGADQPSTFSVTNTGNAVGGLNFSTGLPATFQMPMNASVPANTTVGMTGHFTPAAAQNYTDTSIISKTSATVLCQPLPFTTLALRGQGLAGKVVSVNPANLTFGTGGFSNCGSAAAAAQTIAVKNNSTVSVTVTTTLTAGSSNFTVTGAGTVAAMGTLMLTVTPNAIPAVASTAYNAFGGTLSIHSVGGAIDETDVVSLIHTAEGAILTFNPTGLTFGSNGTQTFTVNNTGNLSAAYALAVGGTQASEFAVTGLTGSTAAGPGSVTHNVTSTRALTPLGAHSANISLTTSAVRCSALPANFTLAN